MAFVQLGGLPVVRTSAQSDVVYWSYCPKPLKLAQQGHEPKKQLFLPGKVENGKYPEAKTWHPESIDGRSYYRLFKNF